MNNVGEILETARRAAGMTQEELADKAGISQGAISRYEKGTRDPDPDALVALAAALGVTEHFLSEAGRARGAMAVDAHMRRRLTAKPTVWRQFEAKLNMYRFHARHLFEEVSLRAEQTIPRFDPAETDPETAARLVRMQWRMPIGPVRSLVRWMESAGCLVLEEDFGTPRIDGMSQWIEEHPVMLLNRRVPTDRKRLTGGHELGHLCLHADDVSEHMEEEANQFAAEFLMPAEVIRPQLRKLTLGRLHDLKRQWGVSMQALVERAHSLGAITLTQRTSFYKAFSRHGWRIIEPVSDELAPEQPRLPIDIGEALSARGLTGDEVARMAGFRDASQSHPFRGEARRLRAL